MIAGYNQYIMDKEFFSQSADQLAPKLLGCRLVHEGPEGIVSGIIVETEAYMQNDAASHSYKGETERTKIMFGPGGHAYVYFTYGMHYCFNVVCGPDGRGEAVLIRALQPVEGVELMQSRRGRSDNIANGPAKLVQAMGINKQHYGLSLIDGDLRIEPADKAVSVSCGPRVGISRAVDVPWRFWITDNPHVSK